MHIRRFLLALSFASSAMSVAFADYQSLNSIESMDRLEQLSRTLGKGSYSQDEQTISNTTLASASQKSVEFNNASLSKYASASTGTWMTAHPVPDARVSSNYGMRTLLGTTRQH